MSFTIPNLHERTRDEGVCPASGHAFHHSQPLVLGQLAGHRRVA